MARMIPPDCPSEAPAGEAILFRKLRDDPGTSGWTVLHSLELRRHRTKSEGEIDMVLLVPEHGILCIEIKGCEVSRRDGQWIYPYGASYEGPFRQASRAMHSLRDYLQKRDSSLSSILCFSAVVFTRIDFKEESPEWHPWQVVNCRSLSRMPVSRVFLDILERGHRHVSGSPASRHWYDPQKSRPSKELTGRIANILRGNFEYVVKPRNDVQRIEESLTRFTEEQYEALDAVQGNARIVFKGLAGTGKTFLAIEAARRAVSEGRRTLLLCYNRLLADWMKETLSGTPGVSRSLFRCLHFHGLLCDIVDHQVSFRDDRDFWVRELPEKAIDLLLADERDYPHFDLLLIDEAQDLLTDEYLDVLDLLVAGGMAGGDWVLFGDFERQAIYLSEGRVSAAHMLDSLCARAPNHTNFSLRINCRNAGLIAETLTLACNVRPGYSRFLYDMEGSSVDPLFWRDQKDQARLLERTIVEIGKAFTTDEIVVLSIRTDERSCAKYLSDSGHGDKLAPLRGNPRQNTGAVRFSTIHAFKGLEAPAIILTDIDQLDDHVRSLLYVGMSRARVRLVLLMKETCRKEYDRMLESGLVSNDKR